MRSLASSWSLCGLAGHRVTALTAVLVWHFLLTTARFSSEENGPLTMQTREAEAEVEDKAVDSANHRAGPKVGVEAQKRLEEDAALTPDLYKRFFIQGFVGSRGKRGTLLKEDWRRGLSEGQEEGEEEEREEGEEEREREEDALLSKRFIQGFVGSRGKRVRAGQAFLPRAASVLKRFRLRGFNASRGRRSLLTASAGAGAGAGL